MKIKLLETDKPKRRMAWVSAAYMAVKLKDIENNITEKTDQDFLKIYQRNFMHYFIDFIHNQPPTLQ